MGSPLGPVLANLFMSFHEKQWLSTYSKSPIHYYKRYVDDIFCLLNSKNDAIDFLNYLNVQHPNIKFTMETETNRNLNFLDISITVNSNQFLTTVHRKSTFSGLLLNFHSFVPLSYKLGLIYTLVDRIYKICHNQLAFNFEIVKIKEFLCKNAYPLILLKNKFSVILPN